MPVITDKQMAKFKTLYKSHFNEDLSPQDALDKAMKLLVMMKIVYKPMTVEQYNRVQESRKRLGLEPIPLDTSKSG
ncbi:MAG: hypothetical protein ABIJ03_04035 [Patescibacteria group bacterium]|nr:hypothetical protein [Patescibacteria group bacterium]